MSIIKEKAYKKIIKRYQNMMEWYIVKIGLKIIIMKLKARVVQWEMEDVVDSNLLLFILKLFFL